MRRSSSGTNIPKSQIGRTLKDIETSLSKNDFSKAAILSASLSTDYSDVKFEFKQRFIRDAAFYSAFGSDFVSAENYNNDSRFDNINDPDYHSIYAMTFFGQRDMDKGLNALSTAEQFSNSSRYFYCRE